MIGELIILPRKNVYEEFMQYINSYPKEVGEIDIKDKTLYLKSANQIKVIKIDNRYKEVMSFLEGYKIGYYDFKTEV